MKVLFTTTVPSPYRVDFFNELGKYCELTVIFERKRSADRDKSWEDFKFDNFNGVFLDCNSKFSCVMGGYSAVKFIKNNYFDKIVVTNFTTVVGMMIVKHLKSKNKPYYLESDGAFVKNGKGFKEKLKKHIISGADGYFSTADEHDRYYKLYGADEDKLIRYPFTSIKKSEVLKEVPTVSEKKALREKLGINEDKMVLAVGQFIHRKGFDVLLKATEKLSKNVGVYIVGGEPTEEYIELKNSLNLSSVHFVGFKNKNALNEYYKVSDLFVHPTREDIWGLVINEAMSCGLPVVTTNRCIAGLEMITDERCIINCDSTDELVNIVSRILSDEVLQENLSKSNLDTASRYTIERMAERHIEVFNSYKV